MTYVYIIAPEGAEKPVKIGLSDNPYSRLDALQTGSPARLRLVELYGFDTRQDAHRMEQDFHTFYAVWRLHGEWFDLEVDDANYWLFERVVVPDAKARGFM